MTLQAVWPQQLGRTSSGAPCRICGNPAGTCADRSAAAIQALVDALSRPKTQTPALQADIFLALAVTGTTALNGLRMLRVPTRQWSAIFDVQNLHNQTVTLQLMGNTRDDYSTASPIAGTVTLAAATSQAVPFSGNLWAPYMGLQISFATAPTSGTLTARGYSWPPDFLG